MGGVQCHSLHNYRRGVGEGVPDIILMTRIRRSFMSFPLMTSVPVLDQCTLLINSWLFTAYLLFQMKGRAIQVEDSIVERQSSMDIRRQLDRDSEVIQVWIFLPIC